MTNNIRYEVWGADHPRFSELEGFFFARDNVEAALVKLEPGKPIELIWVDSMYMDSPEDISLSRDLNIFVQELQKLTGQNREEKPRRKK